MKPHRPAAQPLQPAAMPPLRAKTASPRPPAPGSRPRPPVLLDAAQLQSSQVTPQRSCYPVRRAKLVTSSRIRLLLCAAERDALHSLRCSHLLAAPPDGPGASASACAPLIRVPQPPSERARLGLIRSIALLLGKSFLGALFPGSRVQFSQEFSSGSSLQQYPVLGIHRSSTDPLWEEPVCQ